MTNQHDIPCGRAQLEARRYHIPQPYDPILTIMLLWPTEPDAAGPAQQVVKLLMGVYGAEFTVRAGNGSTPLHWAASKGKRAVIEIIAGNFCAQVCV